MVSKITAV